MGTNSSKNEDEEDEQRKELLIKKYAEYAKNLGNKNNFHKKDNDENIDDMVNFFLLLIKQDENNNNDNNNINNDSIKIDGIIYDINQFVNKGGFGEIYKGKSRKTNKKVAIKIMINTRDIKNEIENEIKFLNLIKNIELNNHPIIEYYGCQITNEKIFISMELAKYDLLTFWFEKVKTRNSNEKFFFGLIIIIYVLRCLIFLEKLNIIHGDIKPQNIVILQYDNSFSIKLIDFGTIEKMFTQRHQITVDINKPYTVFFASPEFLKRDSNNIIKRHLNKKSDAWAAGVMFYFLFFQTLPWKDQYDYENFCNNSNAKDIQVPKQGGYKLIIELLLKKDPKERSSAKATFMQIKSHPYLGKILQSISQRFYPPDDVCYINISQHLRQQLEELNKSNQNFNRSNLSMKKSSSSQSRRSCRYGKNCYRNDLDHHEEFSHPGDSDFINQSEKKICRYGEDCFRTDNEHLQKYIHPNNNKSIIKHSQQTIKEKCRYWNDCFRTDSEHRQKYIHPNITHFQSSTKEICRYGINCLKTSDREHMKKYLHD